MPRTTTVALPFPRQSAVAHNDCECRRDSVLDYKLKSNLRGSMARSIKVGAASPDITAKDTEIPQPEINNSGPSAAGTESIASPTSTKAGGAEDMDPLSVSETTTPSSTRVTAPPAESGEVGSEPSTSTYAEEVLTSDDSGPEHSLRVPANRPRYHLDELSDKQIAGWIMRPDDPLYRCSVSLVEDNRILATEIASRYRSDLAAEGYR